MKAIVDSVYFAVSSHRHEETHQCLGVFANGKIARKHVDDMIKCGSNDAPTAVLCISTYVTSCKNAEKCIIGYI